MHHANPDMHSHMCSDIRNESSSLRFKNTYDLANIMQMSLQKIELELCARCTIFLLRNHMTKIMATHALVDVLHKLNATLRGSILTYRDQIGTNLAALRFANRIVESKRTAYDIDETELPVSKTKKSSKRKRKQSSVWIT